jgi:DNA polymerase elongation subunit (family B)
LSEFDKILAPVVRTKDMTDFEHQWAKMSLNSDYKAYASPGPFRLYDPELARAITVTGQEILHSMLARLGEDQ